MDSITSYKKYVFQETPEEFGGNLVHFFEKVLAEYLDYDIVQMNTQGFGNVYYILNTDLMRELIAKNSSRMIKIPHGNKVLERFIGDSVFVSNGTVHKNQRRWMNPVFNKKQMDQLTDGIAECTQSFIENWKDGEEIDGLSSMMELVIRVIVTNIFGSHDKNLDLISRTLNRLLQVFATPRPLTAEEEQEVEELIVAFDEMVYSGIKLRKTAPEQYNDLLSMLITAQNNSESAQGTEQEIRNNIGTLFLAGYEATATTLIWTLYLLASQPEMDQKLISELNQVLDGRPPELTDVPNLLYTNQLLLESMRLFPPSYQIGRKVTEDIELPGETVSEGSVLLFSQYIMHRHPRYFSHPLDIKPERFSRQFIGQLDNYAYFPFGLGSRICLGKDLSLVMLAIMTAVIAKDFRFELANDHSVEPLTLTTLIPKDKIHLIVRKR